MSDFREIVRSRLYFEVQKSFRLLKFIHVVYRFEARDLENQNIWLLREIFKYRENMSNNGFRETQKSFLKIAKH